MNKYFKKFTLFQPVHTTTTSTTWSGLTAYNPRCYGCMYSCVMYGKLVCHHASRIMANGLHGQECVSFISRNEK